jgi:hypothetical protein
MVRSALRQSARPVFASDPDDLHRADAASREIPHPPAMKICVLGRGIGETIATHAGAPAAQPLPQAGSHQRN